MKTLLLAGGFGTRFSEETDIRPKPMIQIGAQPILWHIMKIYSHYGFNDFVILLGYKGDVIKEYFMNYFMRKSDISIDCTNGKVDIIRNHSEPWKITMLETGLNTYTGGRILRAKDVVGDEAFMLTYGDGVSNVDISDLLKFHYQQKKLVTMTAYQPEGRFGSLNIDDSSNVTHFREKPKGDGQWINSGFFVCEPQAFDYIRQGDSTIWEQEPLNQLAADRQLAAFKHTGFWQPMDTLKDKNTLNDMWNNDKALWKIWDKQTASSEELTMVKEF